MASLKPRGYAERAEGDICVYREAAQASPLKAQQLPRLRPTPTPHHSEGEAGAQLDRMYESVVSPAKARAGGALSPSYIAAAEKLIKHWHPDVVLRKDLSRIVSDEDRDQDSPNGGGGTFEASARAAARRPRGADRRAASGRGGVTEEPGSR